MGQLAGAYPQSVNVTPEERESIERVNVSLFFYCSFIQVLWLLLEMCFLDLRS
jgi:hypothetical protein